MSYHYMDFIMLLHLVALFYVFIGLHSDRPDRYRGAPTGQKDDEDDKEQGSPNTRVPHKNMVFLQHFVREE